MIHYSLICKGGRTGVRTSSRLLPQSSSTHPANTDGSIRPIEVAGEWNSDFDRCFNEGLARRGHRVEESNINRALSPLRRHIDSRVIWVWVVSFELPEVGLEVLPSEGIISSNAGPLIEITRSTILGPREWLVHRIGQRTTAENAYICALMEEHPPSNFALGQNLCWPRAKV